MDTKGGSRHERKGGGTAPHGTTLPASLFLLLTRNRSGRPPALDLNCLSSKSTIFRESNMFYYSRYLEHEWPKPTVWLYYSNKIGEERACVAWGVVILDLDGGLPRLNWYPRCDGSKIDLFFEVTLLINFPVGVFALAAVSTPVELGWVPILSVWGSSAE